MRKLKWYGSCIRTILFNHRTMNNDRTYRNDEITVYWKPDLCCHSTRCIRNLPGVFNLGRKPWIDLSAGSTAKIIETVEMCPTGALSYKKHVK